MCGHGALVRIQPFCHPNRGCMMVVLKRCRGMNSVYTRVLSYELQADKNVGPFSLTPTNVAKRAVIITLANASSALYCVGGTYLTPPAHQPTCQLFLPHGSTGALSTSGASCERLDDKARRSFCEASSHGTILPPIHTPGHPYPAGSKELC